MTTLFERIIAGEIPARRLWSDDRCVAFLTISPVTAGHALVVPRHAVDHWLDAPDDLMAHLVATARTIGAAQLAEFGGERSGLVVQGYGVPHLHLHVFPTTGPEDFHALEGRPAQDADLDDAAERLRSRLRAQGASGVTDGRA
ncbi:diadenosine tetraphosphate hydrolase [Serinibacter arcticus]|uniref:Diadenosine tetraphosphate hydrolase n=1 Tax=Serinibacter arcticus TaxID=1655435 RepID=A0A2U1ZZH1_9MICO|nr:HIT family protein [Serinibacter arcticus]PWD52312.1 diadenosine tetraphosphate hydrolase [Serinibacter arcticus]